MIAPKDRSLTSKYLNNLMSDQIIKYAELVDVTSLQTLMDSLNQVLGIANAIIDTDGIFITSSGWQETSVQY